MYTAALEGDTGTGRQRRICIRRSSCCCCCCCVVRMDIRRQVKDNSAGAVWIDGTDTKRGVAVWGYGYKQGEQEREPDIYTVEIRLL